MTVFFSHGKTNLRKKKEPAAHCKECVGASREGEVSPPLSDKQAYSSVFRKAFCIVNKCSITEPDPASFSASILL